MTNSSSYQKIIFPTSSKLDWRLYLYTNLKTLESVYLEIDCNNCYLNCKDIMEIQMMCERKKIKIDSIKSTVIETIISSSSLGIKATLDLKVNKNNQPVNPEGNDFYTTNQEKTREVFFHQGTLRSGQSIEAINDLLVLGDINPGAIVTAGGDILIWGRLLGIAHAGKNGNINSTISALELRPVQLRIANTIARGPEEKPEEGLAEEASLEDGRIVIKPARTSLAKR
ncbi:septum site-determining protein MinC [Prochlorococcus marinus]|uniref:septum site-determining protein MinC n=1 Tax=Prochlorococcus marinus TaxID=1219 RepID=UPI0022B579D2|nr:septum site-determining protein MinC [Prochlorococcus marinus]